MDIQPHWRHGHSLVGAPPHHPAHSPSMEEDFRSQRTYRKHGKLLAVGSLADHLAKQHSIYQFFVLDEDEKRCVAVA